jgi:NTP pyrophosphatase (non-canonical NTP hydrolase)
MSNESAAKHEWILRSGTGGKGHCSCGQTFGENYLTHAEWEEHVVAAQPLVPATEGRPRLEFQAFSKFNRRRCESPEGFNHTLNSWSLSDWFTALVGEVGEAANIAKKLNRVRDGIPGNDKTPEQLRLDLADELADVDIYLDLLYQAAGIDRERAIIAKFNRSSQKVGYPHELRAALAESPATEGLRDALQKGIDLVESAFAHVSHGGPTRADAEKWLKEARNVLS